MFILKIIVKKFLNVLILNEYKKDFTFIGFCSACEKGLYLKDNKCLKMNEKINFIFKNNNK